MLQNKVIVCGAGIGGLSAAHELAKNGFEVTVFERNTDVGGLARSRNYTDPVTGFSYPTEYSWRVYGTNYKNLLRILNEIPQVKNKRRTVFQNLIKIWTYIFPRFGQREVVVHKSQNTNQLLNKFARGDVIKLLNKTLFCLTMSKGRMNSLDHLT